jgi:hypothetical protein
MLLKDFVDKKAQELKEAGFKSVELRKVTPCKLGKNCFSFMLFSGETVSMEAEVGEVDNAVLDERAEKPGVMLSYNVIKPRCRKVTTEYKYAVIA